MKLNLTKRDPIIEFLQLVKKFLSTRVPEAFSSFLIFVVLALLCCGTVALVAYNGSILKDFRDDVAAPIQFGFLNPLSVVLILRYYKQVPTVFDTALEYVTIPQDELDKLKSTMQRRYASRALLLVSGCLAFVGTVGFFAIRYALGGAYYFDNGCVTSAGALTFVWGLLGTYIIVTWGFKNIVTVLGFLELFTFKIKYNPFHPDARAGIGRIGNLFSWIGVIVLIVGITLVAFLVPIVKTSSNRPSGISTIVLGIPYLLPYLIIPLLVYLFSIYVIHRKMVEGKQDYLQKLVKEEFNLAGSKGILDYYKVMKELPEWPLGFQGVITIVGSLTILAGQLATSPLGQSINQIWNELKKYLEKQLP